MSPLNILQATARASTLVVTAGFSVSGLEPMATTRVPPWRGDSVWAAAAPGRSAVTAMPRATANRARLISISLRVTPTFGDQAPGSAGGALVGTRDLAPRAGSFHRPREEVEGRQ